MADTDNAQKTEPPTEKRLGEARDRGQFARSPELMAAFMLAAALAALAFGLPGMARGVAEYAAETFVTFPGVRLTNATAAAHLDGLMAVFARAFLPVAVATTGAAVLAGSLQSGFHLASKSVGFKPENLNPTKGFSRLFSQSTLVRGGLDLLKLVTIGAVLAMGARALLEDPLFSAPVELAYLGQFLSSAGLAFLVRLLFALSLVAAIGYGWERFQTARDLMMTRQEVQDERKNTEGDAHVKAAMRRMARRVLQKQMLAAVPTADVVVTNPTHFAVALKYERGRDLAPVVLAKGENRFALRIRTLAAEHGVPMVENRPVARLLFALGRVGEGIPPELYQAVAEILAHVYRVHRQYFHGLQARRWEAGS